MLLPTPASGNRLLRHSRMINIPAPRNPMLSVAITDTTMALNPTRMPITPMTRTITRPSTPRPRTITRTHPHLNRPRPLPGNSRSGIRTIRALPTMSTIRDDAPQPLQLHSSPRTRTHLTKLLEPITQIVIPITNIPQTNKLPKLRNPQRKVRRQLPQHLETKFACPSTSSKSNNIRKHAPKGPMRISPPRVPTDHVLRHLTHSFSSFVITLSRFRRNRIHQCTTRSQATKEIPCLTNKLPKPTPFILSRPRITAKPRQIHKILERTGDGIPDPTSHQIPRCFHVRQSPYVRGTPRSLSRARLIPFAVIRGAIHIRIVHMRLVRLHELRATPCGVELVPTLPLRILQIRDELHHTTVKSLPFIHQSRINRIVLHLHGQAVLVAGNHLLPGVIACLLHPGLMICNVFNKLLPHLLQLLQTSRIGIQRRIHRVGMPLHSAGIVIRLVHCTVNNAFLGGGIHRHQPTPRCADGVSGPRHRLESSQQGLGGFANRLRRINRRNHEGHGELLPAGLHSHDARQKTETPPSISHRAFYFLFLLGRRRICGSIGLRHLIRVIRRTRGCLRISSHLKISLMIRIDRAGRSRNGHIRTSLDASHAKRTTIQHPAGNSKRNEIRIRQSGQ